jgi:hypothetical protein
MKDPTSSHGRKRRNFCVDAEAGIAGGSMISED